MSTYNLKQIANEIQATAEGRAFYGNALFVAMDLPFLTAEDKNIIDLYQTGQNRKYGMDSTALRMRLQDIVVKIRRESEGEK